MSRSARRGPDFFILGGMKCGTTSLFNYIGQHPRIAPPADKELHYYDIHVYQGRTLAGYIAQFPEREAGVLSGEGTPFYLTHPHGPAWLARDFPDAKFIVVMRNPVDRFWSQFNQMKRYRHYEGTPQDAIAFEAEHGAVEWQRVLDDPARPVAELKLCSLLRRGCYADQLAQWFAHLPRERFLLLYTEDLQADGANEVSRTLEFLGLDPAVRLDLDRRHHTQDYAPMPADLRATLNTYYAPHNRKLQALLGATPPWETTQ